MRARVQSLSNLCFFVTPWTIAHQAPLPMQFSGQEYWSGLPFPPSGGLLDPEIDNPSLVHWRSPHWHAYSLPLHHLGSIKRVHDRKKKSFCFAFNLDCQQVDIFSCIIKLWAPGTSGKFENSLWKYLEYGTAEDAVQGDWWQKNFAHQQLTPGCSSVSLTLLNLSWPSQFQLMPPFLWNYVCFSFSAQTVNPWE